MNSLFFEPQIGEPAADVSVDFSSISPATDGFSIDNVWMVRLAGPVDSHWRQAFQLVRMEETGFQRFQLNDDRPVVRFKLRSGDGAVAAHYLACYLERLVTLINERERREGCAVSAGTSNHPVA